MRSQMRETLQCFVQCWNVTFRNGPHDEDRLRWLLEPRVLLVVDLLVRGLPNEMLKVFGRLPYRHVDDLLWIIGVFRIGVAGAAFIGHSPNKTRSAICD